MFELKDMLTKQDSKFTSKLQEAANNDADFKKQLNDAMMKIAANSKVGMPVLQTHVCHSFVRDHFAMLHVEDTMHDVLGRPCQGFLGFLENAVHHGQHCSDASMISAYMSWINSDRHHTCDSRWHALSCVWLAALMGVDGRCHHMYFGLVLTLLARGHLWKRMSQH